MQNADTASTQNGVEDLQSLTPLMQTATDLHSAFCILEF
jgi:hypothetical protein